MILYEIFTRTPPYDTSVMEPKYLRNQTLDNRKCQADIISGTLRPPFPLSPPLHDDMAMLIQRFSFFFIIFINLQICVSIFWTFFRCDQLISFLFSLFLFFFSFSFSFLFFSFSCRCWAQEPEDRPCMGKVVDWLERMYENAKGEEKGEIHMPLSASVPSKITTRLALPPPLPIFSYLRAHPFPPHRFRWCPPEKQKTFNPEGSHTIFSKFRWAGVFQMPSQGNCMLFLEVFFFF